MKKLSSIIIFIFILSSCGEVEIQSNDITPIKENTIEKSENTLKQKVYSTDEMITIPKLSDQPDY